MRLRYLKAYYIFRNIELERTSEKNKVQKHEAIYLPNITQPVDDKADTKAKCFCMPDSKISTLHNPAYCLKKTNATIHSWYHP